MKNSENFLKDESMRSETVRYIDKFNEQRLDELDKTLREQKLRIEEALLSKSSYEHMLDRMKVSFRINFSCLER